jgi:hypothetical protein
MINPRELSSNAVNTTEISERANAASVNAPPVPELEALRAHREYAVEAAFQELSSLARAADPAEITSHRSGIGPVIVAGKKLVMTGLQPLLREVFRRQTQFNERVIEALRRLNAKIESSGASRNDLLFRSTATQRLQDLEERVRDLEAKQWPRQR